MDEKMITQNKLYKLLDLLLLAMIKEGGASEK